LERALFTRQQACSGWIRNVDTTCDEDQVAVGEHTYTGGVNQAGRIIG
jgi:hypothetical protein